MEGYLCQRGKGKVWYLVYDANTQRGKRNQRWVKIGKMSKAEAEKRKRDILRKVDDGTWVDDKHLTTKEFLQVWLENREKVLAAKTHERYTSLIVSHVLPVIGETPISKLKPTDLMRVYDNMEKQGLSGTTRRHVHSAMHTALNYGVRTFRVLKENIADRVDAPRQKGREITPFSNEQIRLLMETAKGTRLEAPIILAALTGIRRGELLALRWKNVDFEQGSVFVNEALEQTRKHGLRFKEPKSRSSRRVIPLSPEAQDVLRLHREQQEAGKLQAAFYNDSDLVFCNPDGSPWPPDTLSNQFGQLAALLGLKGFRLHDLRHAFASLTLANGVSVKEVSALLGHSTPMLTLSTYARTIEGLGREAVNGLAKSILAS